MVAFVHTKSVTSCHSGEKRLNRRYSTISLYPTDDERRKQGKNAQTAADKMRYLFLEVPDISLLFPAALKYDKLIILLQT